METLTRRGALNTKKLIDRYWSAHKDWRYLTTWVEQIGQGKEAYFVVRSNAINGLPPSPAVLREINHLIHTKREAT